LIQVQGDDAQQPVRAHVPETYATYSRRECCSTGRYRQNWLKVVVGKTDIYLVQEDFDMHRVLLGLFAIALFASADDPPKFIATVSSPQPFTLDGHTVTSNGMASWPLVVGDQIASADTPVLVALSDGTDLLVNAHSKIKLVLGGNKVQILVLSGSIDNNWRKNHRPWCWVEPPREASKHRCGGEVHDSDERCCPGR
jgi:hypothetical protein